MKTEIPFYVAPFAVPASVRLSLNPPPAAAPAITLNTTDVYGGYTVKQLRDAGWTDSQILANFSSPPWTTQLPPPVISAPAGSPLNPIGFLDAPLSKMPTDCIIKLCDNFRNAVYKAAGVEHPPAEAKSTPSVRGGHDYGLLQSDLRKVAAHLTHMAGELTTFSERQDIAEKARVILADWVMKS